MCLEVGWEWWGSFWVHVLVELLGNECPIKERRAYLVQKGMCQPSHQLWGEDPIYNIGRILYRLALLDRISVNKSQMYFHCCLCLSADNALNTSVTRYLCLSLLAEECHGIWSHPSDFSDHGPMCWWGCLLPSLNRLHVHGEGKKEMPGSPPLWELCSTSPAIAIIPDPDLSCYLYSCIDFQRSDDKILVGRKFWHENAACVHSVAECAWVLHWWVILLADKNCRWF